MSLATAIAQLRHLYHDLFFCGDANLRRLHVGPLMTVIETLEKAHTPGAPVEVKPLIWTVLPYPAFQMTYHTADTGHGRYYQVTVCDLRPDDFRLWTEAKDMEDPPVGTVNGTIHPTLAAAQAAANEEWAAFIRSALQTEVASDRATLQP